MVEQIRNRHERDRDNTDLSGYEYSQCFDDRELLLNQNEKLIDGLKWIVDQFEKVLAGESAGNVVESLSYAKSLIAANKN